MDFKEYLLTQKDFSLSQLAFRMWPNNSKADNYLSAKLNGLAGREFTIKDERLARKALKELGVKLIEDSKKYQTNSSK
jgi:hypothetical protein